MSKDAKTGRLVWGNGAIKTRFRAISPEALKATGGRAMIVQPDEADRFDIRDGVLVYD